MLCWAIFAHYVMDNAADGCAAELWYMAALRLVLHLHRNDDNVIFLTVLLSIHRLGIFECLFQWKYFYCNLLSC